MRLTIYNNIATMSLELRYSGKIRGAFHALNKDGLMVEVELAHEIPCFARLDIDTEVITDLADSNFKALLSQKDKDKNFHIENLNTLIDKILK